MDEKKEEEEEEEEQKKSGEGRKRRRRKRRKECCQAYGHQSLGLPAGAGLQETLAAAEGTQDLASPHIHSAERTADMICI